MFIYVYYCLTYFYYSEDGSYCEINAASQRANFWRDKAQICVFNAKAKLVDWREWQRQFVALLNISPKKVQYLGPSDNPRKYDLTRIIYFIVDKEGGAGKNVLVRLYCDMDPDRCMMLPNGKSGDMAFMMKDEDLHKKEVFFITRPKSDPEPLNGAIAEGIKDGEVYSPKYMTCKIRTTPGSHVIVTDNNDPDLGILVKNRYFNTNTPFIIIL